MTFRCAKFVHVYNLGPVFFYYYYIFILLKLLKIFPGTSHLVCEFYVCLIEFPSSTLNLLR